MPLGIGPADYADVSRVMYAMSLSAFVFVAVMSWAYQIVPKDKQISARTENSGMSDLL
jgi:hypothetical protein